MPKVVRVIRLAPVDCVCSGCKGVTRNVAEINAGSRKMQSYRCDACIDKLAPMFKRPQYDVGRPEPRRPQNLGGGYILVSGGV